MYDLVEKKCKSKSCPNRFRVMPKSKQKYCSEDCMYLNDGKIKPRTKTWRDQETMRYAQVKNKKRVNLVEV